MSSFDRDRWSLATGISFEKGSVDMLTRILTGGFLMLAAGPFSSPLGQDLGLLVINAGSDVRGVHASSSPVMSGPAFIETLKNGVAGVADLHLSRDGAVYVLSTSNSGSRYRSDPDETKTYEAMITVTKIKGGVVVSQRDLGVKYVGLSSGVNMARASMFVGDDGILVFVSEKNIDGRYGQDGYQYELSLDDLNVEYVEQFYENKNWGWFPYYQSNGRLRHFSFAGYRSIDGTRDDGAIEPARAVREMIAARLSTSGGQGNAVANERDLARELMSRTERYANGTSMVNDRSSSLSDPARDPLVVGGCISGDCENGYGVQVDGGDVYAGEFVRGRRQGKGVFKRNGNNYSLTYNGSFFNDIFNGRGILLQRSPGHEDRMFVADFDDGEIQDGSVAIQIVQGTEILFRASRQPDGTHLDLMREETANRYCFQNPLSGGCIFRMVDNNKESLAALMAVGYLSLIVSGNTVSVRELSGALSHVSNALEKRRGEKAEQFANRISQALGIY
jgi:hypothetical protein